ncbi:MAG: DUF7901 domain-containing protein [Chloroflexota bacterium]
MIIYWLDVQADSDEGLFGWKTSLDHWNDDGAWASGTDPVGPTAWSELVYPPGHPMEGQSIDLAFAIRGEEMVTPPPAVSGIAELPDISDSSASSYVALAALAGLMVVALTAGAWYARRRWGM